MGNQDIDVSTVDPATEEEDLSGLILDIPEGEANALYISEIERQYTGESLTGGTSQIQSVAGEPEAQVANNSIATPEDDGLMQVEPKEEEVHDGIYDPNPPGQFEDVSPENNSLVLTNQLKVLVSSSETPPMDTVQPQLKNLGIEWATAYLLYQLAMDSTVDRRYLLLLPGQIPILSALTMPLHHHQQLGLAENLPDHVFALGIHPTTQHYSLVHGTLRRQPAEDTEWMLTLSYHNGYGRQKTEEELEDIVSHIVRYMNILCDRFGGMDYRVKHHWFPEMQMNHSNENSGFYLLQCISAVLLKDVQALMSPLPLPVVKSRLEVIMMDLQEGEIHNVIAGLAPIFMLPKEAQRCRAHGITSRLDIWKNLKAGRLDECSVGLIAGYFWLSALMATPHAHSLFIDPELADALYDMESTGNPLASASSQLWGRDVVWQQMFQDGIVLIMAKPNVGRHQSAAWILVELCLEHNSIKHVEILVPPAETVDLDACLNFVRTIVPALSKVLPSFPHNMQRATRKTKGLILPHGFDEHDTAFVMLALLCGKILFQPMETDRISVPTFRHSLTSFYFNTLRSRDITFSTPWHGLSSIAEGLYGHLKYHLPQPLNQRQASPSTQSDASGGAAIFGAQGSYCVPISESGDAEGFFLELSRPISSFKEDMLVGVGGRNVHALERAAFLGPAPVENSTDEVTGPGVLSLDEFCDQIFELGGPESVEGWRAVLLGQRRDGEPFRLNWMKHSMHLTEEGCLVSTDIDSLCLTVSEAPKFLAHGQWYSYPSRALSLNLKNGLTVRLPDSKPVPMSQIPNICCMTIGPNNQFRVLVFLPACREYVKSRWRNYPTKEEYQGWSDLFRMALNKLIVCSTGDIQHAAIQLKEAMPANYRVAEIHATGGGGSRSFPTTIITPDLLNRLFPIIRQLCARDPRWKDFRGHFFHVIGINIKLAAQNIRRRDPVHPMNSVFRMFDFIPWHEQNPNNITVDFGIGMNVNPRFLPGDFTESTMLWRMAPLKNLLAPSWLAPRLDLYSLSNVVGGCMSYARSQPDNGMIKVQFYMKDMMQTYNHFDNSIGANFTTLQAIHGEPKFEKQMESLTRILLCPNSYGIRLEFRCSAWATNRLCHVEPTEWIRQFISLQSMVCHKYETVARFKLTLQGAYVSACLAQRNTLRSTGDTEKVYMMASLLSYLIKSLVKRPDDMSATREIVKPTGIHQRSQLYGLGSISVDVFEQSDVFLILGLNPSEFRIMHHLNTNRPGGNRLKSSSWQPVPPPRTHHQTPDAEVDTEAHQEQQGERQHTPRTTHFRLEPGVGCGDSSEWGQVDQHWLEEMVNEQMPIWIWDRFPQKQSYFLKSAYARKARTGPLRLAHWSKTLEVATRYRLIETGYQGVIDRLFPSDWEMKVQNPQSKSWDRAVLGKIRERISGTPGHQREHYNRRLRTELTALLQSWDYLPAIQADK
ncbi:hypothetical protein FRC10_001687, partial [Ceratobasidium sp. 414]